VGEDKLALKSLTQSLCLLLALVSEHKKSCDIVFSIRAKPNDFSDVDARLSIITEKETEDEKVNSVL
jgi:hypothetical protein